MKKFSVIFMALALVASALVLRGVDWVGAKATSSGLLALGSLLLGSIYCYTKARIPFVKYGHTLILLAALLSLHGCFTYSTPLAMVELALGGFLVGGCFVSRWLWEMEDITL